MVETVAPTVPSPALTQSQAERINADLGPNAADIYADYLVGNITAFETLLRNALKPFDLEANERVVKAVLKTADAWLERGERIFTSTSLTGEGGGNTVVLWLMRTMHLKDNERNTGGS